MSGQLLGDFEGERCSEQIRPVLRKPDVGGHREPRGAAREVAQRGIPASGTRGVDALHDLCRTDQHR